MIVTISATGKYAASICCCSSVCAVSRSPRRNNTLCPNRPRLVVQSNPCLAILNRASLTTAPARQNGAGFAGSGCSAGMPPSVQHPAHVVGAGVIGGGHELPGPEGIVELLAGEVERAHVAPDEVVELGQGEAARIAQDRAAQAAAVVAVFVDEPGRVHRAPGVADEHERLTRRDGLFDDQAQVLEIASEGVAVRVEALRQPRATLVPELNAVAVVGQRAQRQEVPVVAPGAAVQHDRGRGGGGAERLGVQQRARDLDVRQGRILDDRLGNKVPRVVGIEAAGQGDRQEYWRERQREQTQ